MSSNFPFKRELSVEPVKVPATDTPSKVPVVTLPDGVTSFGVDNTFPIYMRLVGTGKGAAAFNQAGDGKGWVFGPGKHGPFSTQQPEFMSAIAIDRPGYPIKNADGTLRFPEAVLEVFYGSGMGGWGGSGTPYVNVMNWPANLGGGTSSAVTVSNFPDTQKVSGTVGISGTVPVSGTFWPTTQPVSGSVSVSNFPATQPISGSVTVSNFPATQPVSIAQSVNVNDANGSLTVDSPQIPATLGAKAGAASMSVVPATDALFQVSDRGSASMATKQITLGATAVEVVPARAGRRKVTISSAAGDSYFFGNSGVTATTGFLMANGGAHTLDTAAAVFAGGQAGKILSVVEHFG